jgi:hypothetical protein
MCDRQGEVSVLPDVEGMSPEARRSEEFVKYELERMLRYLRGRNDSSVLIFARVDMLRVLQDLELPL